MTGDPGAPTEAVGGSCESASTDDATLAATLAMTLTLVLGPSDGEKAMGSRRPSTTSWPTQSHDGGVREAQRLGESWVDALRMREWWYRESQRWRPANCPRATAAAAHAAHAAHARLSQQHTHSCLCSLTLQGRSTPPAHSHALK
jgi:hypothetical protein